ncbi:tripartite tricarboxylate transporter substrate binding protein [Roseococcus sp. YIM B11640]|uniref:tripartite tricarboxylate transporter substrate binding protein n=1 Tax=Roseococcus sp. YIM B11640 TaxID=3133973 RepID=UPI003C79EB38
MFRRALLAALATPAIASGQTAWPSQPVRLIVPYAAGGPTDVAARLVAEALAARLGQRVVVENRTGAGTVVGSDAAAKARDGHSLLVATVAHAVNPALVARLPFDPATDFRGVSLLGTVPQVVLVNKELPVRDLAGFLALAKARPGQLSYGSAGQGSAQHLAAELMKVAAGVDMVHIPYRGAAPAVTDMIAGNLAMVIDSAATALPQIRSGAVRALAVTSREKLPLLPELPTVAGTLPGYEAYTWNALLAPVSTTEAAVAAMNAALAGLLREGALRGRLEELGIAVVGDLPPEGVDRFVAAEMTKWQGVLRQAGIRAE